MLPRRSLTVQETDMFAKTRRECIPVGSVAASLLLTVLVNMFVFGTKPSQIALDVAEIGSAILVRVPTDREGGLNDVPLTITELCRSFLR
jgi:branched-subunit amino acid permease